MITRRLKLRGFGAKSDTQDRKIPRDGRTKMANCPEYHMPLNQAGTFHGVEPEEQCAIKTRKIAT